MRNLATAAACVITALSVTACGSSSTDSATRTATASLKSELLQQSASAASPFTFSDAQAQCAASKVVGSVGTARLQTYGLLNAQNQATPKTLDATTLSAADATAVVHAIVDCLGPANVTHALTAAVGKSLPGTRTAAQRACLESKLTIGALEPMLIETLSGHPTAAQTFYASLASCIPRK